jgi:glycosyltransferase involved in cell wall biosynthesis
MHILVVGFYPPDGAVPDLFRQTVEHLARTATVSVFCQTDPQLNTQEIAETHFIPYSKQSPLSFLSQNSWRELRAVARKKFDVVFFYTQHILQVPVAFALQHTPQVMWWHEPPGQARGRYLNRIMYRSHDAIMTRRAAAIVVACKSMLQLIPKRLTAKIHIVPLPFNERFTVSDSRHSPLAADLIFWGKVEPFKGLDVLADAMNLLYAQGKLPTLSVIGPGNMVSSCPQLLKLASSYPERIRITNKYVEHSKLTAAIRDSRVVVMPYLSAVGASTLPIAYHHAKPVIASRVGSFNDWVIENKTGILVSARTHVELAQQIQRLLQDKALQNRLGDNAYKYYIDNFRAEAINSQLLKVFQMIK